MPRLYLPTLIVTLSLMLSACSNTESENVATAGMSIRMEVEQKNEDQSVISVYLYAGEPGISATNLRLNGSDTLLATYDGVQKSLAEKAVGFGKYEYWTTFETTTADKEFKVSLLRESYVDALNNVITLRSDFDVTHPNGDGNYSYDLDYPSLTTTWSPTEITEYISITVDAECVETETGATRYAQRTVETPDNGSYLMDNFLDLEAYKNTTFTNCNGELIYQRNNTGSVDSAFGEGGNVYGKRTETIQLSANH